MLNLPEYPGAATDSPEGLLAVVPSFWYTYFDDADFIKTLFLGKIMLQRQAKSDLREVELSVDRHTVPVHHVDVWKPYVIRRSATVRRGTDSVYGASGTYGMSSWYGAPRGEPRWEHPIPSDVRHVGALAGTITVPGDVLVGGVDFKIDRDRSVLVFAVDPFSVRGAAAVPVFGPAGDVIDEYVTLWGLNNLSDRRYLDAVVGAVIRVYCDSSPHYRRFVNSLYDMLQTGMTARGLKESVMACMGVPTPEPDEDSAVVAIVRELDGYTCVCTEKHVYRLPPGAVPAVAVGDRVGPDTDLDTTVRLLLLNTYDPDYASVPGLSLKPDAVGPDYFLQFMFPSERWAKETGDFIAPMVRDVRIKTVGFDNDTSLFWEKTNARSFARKAAAPDAPAYLDEFGIPAAVSPFEFFSRNVFGNNTVAVVVQADCDCPDAPGLRYTAYLQNAIPPRTKLFIYAMKTAGARLTAMGTPSGAAAVAAAVGTSTTRANLASGIRSLIATGECCVMGKEVYTGAVDTTSPVVYRRSRGAGDPVETSSANP